MGSRPKYFVGYMVLRHHPKLNQYEDVCGGLLSFSKNRVRRAALSKMNVGNAADCSEDDMLKFWYTNQRRLRLAVHRVYAHG